MSRVSFFVDGVGSDLCPIQRDVAQAHQSRLLAQLGHLHEVYSLLTRIVIRRDVSSPWPDAFDVEGQDRRHSSDSRTRSRTTCVRDPAGTSAGPDEGSRTRLNVFAMQQWNHRVPSLDSASHRYVFGPVAIRPGTGVFLKMKGSGCQQIPFRRNVCQAEAVRFIVPGSLNILSNCD